MKAVCCDRCGKFEKAANLRQDSKPWLVLNRGSSISNPAGELAEIMLCDVCAQDFQQYLHQFDAVKH